MSSRKTFDEVLAARVSRRGVLKGSLSLAAASLFGGCQPVREALKAETGPANWRSATLSYRPRRLRDYGDTTYARHAHDVRQRPLPHPGRNDPSKPRAISSWPDGEKGGRPHSATIAIRREDGGVVGT
jgi:secreted PhoX family phosphatase